MVTSPMSYSKHVFIAYSYPDENFALWLHRRLLYAGIPAWIDKVDILLAAGITSSIERAAGLAVPMVIVLSPDTNEDEIERWRSFSNYREPLLALVRDVSESRYLRGYQIFDFRKGWGVEFNKLIIEIKENGIQYESIERIDGKWFFETAKQNEKKNWQDLAIYYYTKAMYDFEDTEVRSLAVKNLSKLTKNYYGAIWATLNDPSKVVRAEAIQAIARIGDHQIIDFLNTLAISDTSATVRLYAHFAIRVITNPESLAKWLASLLQETTSSELKKAILFLRDNIDNFLQFRQSIKPKPNSQVSRAEIFISYARRDAEAFALSLADKLIDKGYTVWIDTDLEPSTPVWTHEIEKAIESAQICIFVISPAVKSSEWVPKEWHYASQLNKEILPVIYIDTILPLYMSSSQTLRPNTPFVDDPDKMFDVLLKVLAKKLR